IDQLTAWSELKKELNSKRFRGVMVSLSGGLDSTALFQGIWHLYQREKFFDLGVYHCAYGLRGDESKDDFTACRKLAEERGIPFVFREITEEERDQRQGEGVQAWARRLRRADYDELADAGWIIALGHHSDDLAENVLLRLARGASPGKLLGMKAWDAPIWRPLLNCSKNQLRDFIASEGLTYREDSSNLKDDYARNRLRHQVLPVLEELYPGAAGRIVACAAEARAQEEALDEPDGSGRDDLTTLSLARHRLANEIKAKKGGHTQLSRRLLDAAISGQSPSLPGGDGLRVGRNLTIESQDPSAKGSRSEQHARALGGPSRRLILEAGSYAYLTTTGGKYELRTPMVEVADQAASIDLCIESGSTVQPLVVAGTSQRLSMKNLMQQRGVPVKLRAAWRSLTCQGKTLGIFDGQKFHPANTLIPKSGCSKLYVNLRYLKDDM
ncbi:MAG: hypothetical protein RL011_759, partial [Pseudomonadota bacterium]